MKWDSSDDVLAINVLPWNNSQMPLHVSLKYFIHMHTRRNPVQLYSGLPSWCCWSIPFTCFTRPLLFYGIMSHFDPRIIKEYLINVCGSPCMLLENSIHILTPLRIKEDILLNRVISHCDLTKGFPCIISKYNIKNLFLDF